MPIPTVTHAILMEYRSMIQRLPPNSTKGKATRTTPLQELVKMKHPKTVSLTRVNHILMPLTGLFRWLQKHEIIKDNPAHSLLLPKGRHNIRPDEQRKRYTNEQVHHIIDIVRDFKENHAERFWIPCIAAFSAMRVNEIAQLYLDDLRELDNIWCFEIAGGRDKRVKNLSSQRTVPIHPLLQQWGLLEYAAGQSKNGADRLFPGLRRHRRNGYAHQIIAWWSRFKGRISSDTRLSFHSLRHSACDEMKQNKVDPAVIAEILGHSSGSITMERYGKRFASKILLDAIITINYGYDV